MNAIGEVLSNWRRSFSLQLTTTLIMGLCFSTILVLVLIAKNIQSSFAGWGNKVEMSVYLAEDLSEEEASTVKKALSRFSEVKTTQFMSKEKAKLDFYANFADMVPELDSFSSENPFLASFEIVLNKIPPALFSVKFLETLKDRIQGIEGVDEVGYGKYWFESYAGIMRGINSSVAIIAIILSLASLLIVGNSIRALVFKRKREVEVLELIGATAHWVRMPFILGGAFMGLAASLVSLFASAFVYGIVTSKFSTAIKALGVSNQINFFSSVEAIVVVVLGITIGSIGSYLCIRGINSGWSAVQVVDQ